MKRHISFRTVSVGLLILLLSVSPFDLHAQDTGLLDRMCANLSDSCAEMTCSWSARISGVNTSGSAEMKIQDDLWSLSGNGVGMWCDAVSVWVLDMVLKEAVIEPVATDDEDVYLTNPALMFVGLDEHFEVEVSRPTEDGAAVFYSMRPRKESAQVEFLDIEILSSDASIRNGRVAMKSGDIIKIEVSSMKLTPKVSVEAFRPQNVFDSSWIVTDLR